MIKFVFAFTICIATFYFMNVYLRARCLFVVLINRLTTIYERNMTEKFLWLSYAIKFRFIWLLWIYQLPVITNTRIRDALTSEWIPSGEISFSNINVESKVLSDMQQYMYSTGDRFVEWFCSRSFDIIVNCHKWIVYWTISNSPLFIHRVCCCCFCCPNEIVSHCSACNLLYLMRDVRTSSFSPNTIG